MFREILSLLSQVPLPLLSQIACLFYRTSQDLKSLACFFFLDLHKIIPRKIDHLLIYLLMFFTAHSSPSFKPSPLFALQA